MSALATAAAAASEAMAAAGMAAATHGPRMSGHQKEVFTLYRAFLRAIKKKNPVCFACSIFFPPPELCNKRKTKKNKQHTHTPAFPRIENYASSHAQ